jgi:hypothetical protein
MPLRASAEVSILREADAGGSPGSAASPWTIAGTADFDGDGKTDILWYNTTTGQAVIWVLNGATVLGGGSPGSAASPWSIVGTGDFNGDGRSDILWYNSASGQVLIWFMNSITVTGGESLARRANRRLQRRRQPWHARANQCQIMTKRLSSP